MTNDYLDYLELLVHLAHLVKRSYRAMALGFRVICAQWRVIYERIREGCEVRRMALLGEFRVLT